METTSQGCSMKIVAWNLAQRAGAWRCLLDSDADVALVQEATEPPPDVAARLEVDFTPWWTAGAGLNRPWRAAVVKLSGRVGVRWIEPKSAEQASPGELAVSWPGTLAAAIVTPPSGEDLVLASLYAPWERPLGITGSRWIYADGSAHRLISDLSVFVGQQAGHRIIAAGDLNILHGYGEHGSSYWAGRYATIFARMSALGLSFVGPQAPAGRSADPRPDELPRASRDVPTYHTSRQTPATATRQLDFVFASAGLAGQMHVKALNDPEDWGPSDHCRIEIQISR
jgi:hypothetical protein